MSRYASETTVSSEQSRAEIEKTLTRYGATAFGYGWDGPKAVIMFRAHDRHLKFMVTMPQTNDRAYTHDKVGRALSPRAIEGRVAQASRQRWRALALVIKAKLEAVDSGITTFEHEFMAQVVMPDGKTLGEHAVPLIAQAYSTGKMPPLLPHLGD